MRPERSCKLHAVRPGEEPAASIDRSACAECSGASPTGTNTEGQCRARPFDYRPGRDQSAQAYYHLALASVMRDDAVSDGRSDEINKAIEEYKLALNADPTSRS